MNSTDGVQAGIILFLVLLSAFFSSAETALTTVNKIKIRTLAQEGNKRAETLLTIIENPGRLLGTILVGNNIVNLAASSLMTTLTLRLFGNIGVSVGTGVLTLLILIVGEIAPKTLATSHAEQLSLAYAPVIRLLIRILTPVVMLTNFLARLLLLLLRVDPNATEDVMTEDELRTYVDVSHEDGVIEQEEKQMIINVFDFGDTQAKDVMIPRVDIVSVDVNSSYAEILKVFREEKFSRLPVYEESVDNVIGVLNLKDVFFYNDEDFDMRALMREPFFTYEHKKTSELLEDMRKNSHSFAIVLDEYGATSGLITLEDLIEEIVGEIRDEYDEDEEEQIQKISDTEYLIDGSVKLDDINDALDLLLHSEDYDSIGGLLIESLDDLPSVGEEALVTGDIRLVVEAVDKNRIDKVHLYLPEKQEEDAEASAK
ncbi:MAG: hemolysin family protein [Eubacteriales bacterium]|nr:hemolysin family protein [Eubacteriales bacterium]